MYPHFGCIHSEMGKKTSSHLEIISFIYIYIVTSLQSLNLNLNSAVFKYVALLYKGKVVIANQFLYQNTPYGTLMSPNLNCGLATQLSLINLNLKSAVSKYVAFQLKGKTVIANQFLYQNTP